MVDEPKILLWDVESTALNATFGTLLCIGWKFHDHKVVHVPTILDSAKDGMLDDSGLVKTFAKTFGECDYHITWYGSRFDLPMLNSKLLKYGEPPLPPKPHIDLWRVARDNFKLHSNRLAVWSEFLDVEHHKTAIDYDSWLWAALGNKAAIKDVVDHCRLDVIVLEEVFNKMKPWIKDAPAHQLFFPDRQLVCTSCGSDHIQQRGFQVSRTRKYKRFQCVDCGHWMRANLSERDQRPTLIG